MRRYLLAIADGNYGCGNEYTYGFTKPMQRAAMTRMALAMRTSLVNHGHREVSVYYVTAFPQKWCEMEPKDLAQTIQSCGVKII